MEVDLDVGMEVGLDVGARDGGLDASDDGDGGGALDAPGGDVDTSELGCTCRAGRSSAPWAGMLLLVALLARRR